MSLTVERLNTNVQRALTEIIQKDLKDPSVGFCTITSVEITNDLSFATVYVSFLGSDKRSQAGLKALNRASGYLRREVGRKVQMRKVPELIFKIDESMQYGMHIDELLAKVNKGVK